MRPDETVHVELIAVPYDSGRQGQRMGAGPAHLLQAGLGTRLEDAGHRVHIRTLDLPPGSWPAEIRAAFDLAGAVARAVDESIADGRFPLVLSGNCGPAAIGCVSGLRSVSRVLWFDAHADFNTPETTVTGFLDGMALAAVTGRCWTQLTRAIPGFVPVPESGVTLIGARDVDDLEAATLRRTAVRCVSTHELRAELPTVLAADNGSRPTSYLHLDLDVLDPREGTVNCYATPGGLDRSDLEWAIARIAEAVDVRASSLTAFDPGSDVTGRACESALAVAVGLVQAVSAAGR
jgi:arginase